MNFVKVGPDKEKHFIGIYQLEENHILKPHKLFL